MATSCISLDGVPAVVEWHYDGATKFLSKPDPDNLSIRFTLEVDATGDDSQRCALFEIMIPFRFKDQTSSTIYVRISPLAIASFSFSTEIDLPDALKAMFLSTPVTRLDFQLENSVTVLIPSYVKEPVRAARLRSGKILDSLFELSHAAALRIYIQDSSPSLEQLNSIITAVAQRQLQPFFGPDHDTSRMFSGSGAKVTKLLAPLPPSYDKTMAFQPQTAPLYDHSTSFDPPTASSHKRKRTQTQQAPPNLDAIWEKLQTLETIVHDRAAQDVQPGDQSQLIQTLRVGIVGLREQLARCEKKYADLEAEVVDLRQAQATTNETEDAQIIEMRDDIKDLENRVDFIERGKDDEDFSKKMKEEIYHELAARVVGG